MKQIFIITITSALAAITSHAAAPKNPSMDEFRGLLGDKSPFIIKKPPERVVQAPVNTSLSLRGVSRFKSGWIVTLVDRKDSKKNIILREGEAANKGLKLVRVNQNEDDYAQTSVVVLTGGRQVTVNFDMNAIQNNRKQAAKPVAGRRNPNTRPTIPVKSATKQVSPPRPSTSGRRPRVRRSQSN